MITRLKAKNFLSLRDVDQPLRRFQILIGPNGSGKSAFLDVIWFLSTMVREGNERAVERRSRSFYDLVWGRDQASFELSVEADPGVILEVVARLDRKTESVRLNERVVKLISPNGGEKEHRNDQSPHLSILNQLRGDPVTTPLTEAFHNTRLVQLDAAELRKPSPPGASAAEYRGAQLPRMIELLKENPEQFNRWIAHLQTALPDLTKIRTVLRAEDRHRYAMVNYRGGIEVPSWMESEGTLRLLALTVLAYLPFAGIYLIEEPETGLHPTAIETVYQSLSSVYEGQVLIATHEPMLVSLASPEELLCFTKTENGTEIVSGDKHPTLENWRNEVTLGEVFATGLLS